MKAGDVVDRPDRHLGLFEEGHVLVHRAGRHEFADDAVELLHMDEPLLVRVEARIVAEFGPANRAQHPHGHALRRGR